MLNPFGKKARLVRAVEKLCLYNDKGAFWHNHAQSRIETERKNAVEKIRELAEEIGAEELPEGFAITIESKDFAEDLEGRYIAMLRSHFESAKGN